VERWLALALWPVVSLSITWAWEEMAVCCMGQQHPGRHLGQLKPWECRLNRNPRHFYYCIVQHYCVFVVEEVFFWESGDLLEHSLFNDLIKIALRISGLLRSLLSSFCLPILLFLSALRGLFDNHMPSDLLLDSAADDPKCKPHSSNDMH